MTTKRAWTEGPWKLVWWGNEEYPFPLTVHTSDDDKWIARDGITSSLANARLISAAPDLYDGVNALIGLLQLVAGRDDISPEVRDALTNSHRIDEARAALAKADGRKT